MRKRYWTICLLASSFLFLSGCSLISGPNRIFKTIRADTAKDFITFEGVTTTKCLNLYSNIPHLRAYGSSEVKNNVVIGCVLTARPVGKDERAVLCVGKIYDTCMEIPVGAQITINGEIVSDSIIIRAKAAKWSDS